MSPNYKEELVTYYNNPLKRKLISKETNRILLTKRIKRETIKQHNPLKKSCLNKREKNRIERKKKKKKKVFYY
tara:strand:+ start:157 stop:375 length:219 start_codon:yes stop_codon:yes gene_type:complete